MYLSQSRCSIGWAFVLLLLGNWSSHVFAAFKTPGAYNNHNYYKYNNLLTHKRNLLLHSTSDKIPTADAAAAAEDNSDKQATHSNNKESPKWLVDRLMKDMEVAFPKSYERKDPESSPTVPVKDAWLVEQLEQFAASMEARQQQQQQQQVSPPLNDEATTTSTMATAVSLTVNASSPTELQRADSEDPLLARVANAQLQRPQVTMPISSTLKDISSQYDPMAPSGDMSSAVQDQNTTMDDTSTEAATISDAVTPMSPEQDQRSPLTQYWEQLPMQQDTSSESNVKTTAATATAKPKIVQALQPLWAFSEKPSTKWGESAATGTAAMTNNVITARSTTRDTKPTRGLELLLPDDAMVRTRTPTTTTTTKTDSPPQVKPKITEPLHPFWAMQPDQIKKRQQDLDLIAGLSQTAGGQSRSFWALMPQEQKEPSLGSQLVTTTTTTTTTASSKALHLRQPLESSEMMMRARKEMESVGGPLLIITRSKALPSKGSMLLLPDQLKPSSINNSNNNNNHKELEENCNYARPVFSKPKSWDALQPFWALQKPQQKAYLPTTTTTPTTPPTTTITRVSENRSTIRADQIQPLRPLWPLPAAGQQTSFAAQRRRTFQSNSNSSTSSSSTNHDSTGTCFLLKAAGAPVFEKQNSGLWKPDQMQWQYKGSTDSWKENAMKTSTSSSSTSTTSSLLLEPFWPHRLVKATTTTTATNNKNNNNNSSSSGSSSSSGIALNHAQRKLTPPQGNAMALSPLEPNSADAFDIDAD